MSIFKYRGNQITTESKPNQDRFHQTALWDYIKTLQLEYEFHPIANIFPLIDGNELEELVQDIKKNGLLKHIVLYENKILDGRNRYIACKKGGIPPRFKQYNKGIDPLSFVISENLKRRHLNNAQLAEIGLIILEEQEKKALERQRITQLNGKNKDNEPIFKSSVMSSEDITDKDIQSQGESKSITQNKELRSNNNGERGSARNITAKQLGITHETLTTAKKVKELNDPQINKKWEQAKQGKTTIKAVKMAIDKKNKPKEIPKLPGDKFDVIYADPAWEYEFTESPNRSIEKEYPTMDLKEICKLKIPSAENAILFLWVTSPKLYPEGMEVIKAWGFTYKTSMVWVKDKIGMGYYARNRHEFILIGTKGTPGTPDPANRPDSVIEAPRTEHSKKPEIVYELIEKMYPNRKYLELFARNKREKWKSWGNEIES